MKKIISRWKIEAKFKTFLVSFTINHFLRVTRLKFLFSDPRQHTAKLNATSFFLWKMLLSSAFVYPWKVHSASNPYKVAKCSKAFISFFVPFSAVVCSKLFILFTFDEATAMFILIFLRRVCWQIVVHVQKPTKEMKKSKFLFHLLQVVRDICSEVVWSGSKKMVAG